MGQVVNMKNKTRRMLTVELEHPQAPRRRHVHYQRARNKKGHIGVKVQRLGIHDALFLPSGVELFGLPLYVATTPDVQRLVESGVVEVVYMDEMEAVRLERKAIALAEKEAAAAKVAMQIKADKRRKAAEAYAARMAEKSAPQPQAKPAPARRNGKKAKE